MTCINDEKIFYFFFANRNEHGLNNWWGVNVKIEQVKIINVKYTWRI